MGHFETSILIRTNFVIQLCALVFGQNSSGIDCDSLFGQTQLFFEPVSNYSAISNVSSLGWTFDDDNAYWVYGYVNYDYPEYCYDAYCLTIWQYDYDGEEYEPMFISPDEAISTLGYWQIHIIYSVAVPSWSNDTICSSSYSVDDGGVANWAVIQESYVNDTVLKQIVAAPLPEDASDVEYLSIALSQSSRVAKTSSDECHFDEIRICGTPITAAETSTTEIAAQTDAITTVEVGKSTRKAIFNMNIAIVVVCGVIYNL